MGTGGAAILGVGVPNYPCGLWEPSRLRLKVLVTLSPSQITAKVIGQLSSSCAKVLAHDTPLDTNSLLWGL